MFASCILSLRRKDCDCKVMPASIRASSLFSSAVLRADDRLGAPGHAVQLQPFGGERPKRRLVAVPRTHDVGYRLHTYPKERADGVLLAPPFPQLTRDAVGLSRDRESEEAVAPTVPPCFEAACHPLGSQRFKCGCQQGFVCWTHDTLLSGIRAP